MWSESLKKKTLEYLNEQGAGMVKSCKGGHGMASVGADGSCTVAIVGGGIMLPTPTGEELHFDSVEELIAAGWVVD